MKEGAAGTSALALPFDSHSHFDGYSLKDFSLWRRKCEFGSLPGFSPEQTGRNVHRHGMFFNFPLPISDFTQLNKLENKASEYGSTLQLKM